MSFLVWISVSKLSWKEILSQLIFCLFELDQFSDLILNCEGWGKRATITTVLGSIFECFQPRKKPQS